MEEDDDDDYYGDHAMALDERGFRRLEKKDGQYFIGYTQYVESESAWLFVYAISARSFFRHSIELVSEYLYEFGHVYHEGAGAGAGAGTSANAVDILQLCILEDGLYTSIVKTHWIRLIQRHWRKVIGLRRAMWQMRARPSEQLLKQRTGRYSVGLRSMPGLVGMMSHYLNVNKYKN
jgi:hypothetical protein